MCYAIPGKVVELRGRVALIDYFGEKRSALNEFINAKVGDYVYAQGGMVIDKINAKDAITILENWKEKFFELKKIDAEIANKKSNSANNLRSRDLQIILNKAEADVELQRQDLLKLLKLEKQEDLDLLFQTANKLRQQNLQNSCCVHGIIEFSNYCRNDCFYCGIRKSNSNLQRYRLSVDEIVGAAEYAVNTFGFKALVLQSGEDMHYSEEMLVEIVKKIREKCAVLLFMSVGEQNYGCYKRMYDAGARGVLLRFETSNLRLFAEYHKGNKSELAKRIGLIKQLIDLGYLVATGSLIGLPNQTNDDIINDILLVKSFKVDMYSFGPLIPHPDTPFSGNKLPNLNDFLKVIAISRLIDKNAKILVTTALETLDNSDGKRLGLLAGANSLMINATPKQYKGLYSIYPNKAGTDIETKELIEKTLTLLYSLGRAPTDLGFDLSK